MTEVYANEKFLNNLNSTNLTKPNNKLDKINIYYLKIIIIVAFSLYFLFK
jgi:hypothetical protein